MSLDQLARNYERDGYISGVPILSEDEAGRHRIVLEDREATDGKLHFKSKVHTVMTSPFELATHPKVLDVVEALIGPDILLYDVTYIVKEPHTDAFISWHQDLTFWGLSDDAQVSMWLALSPATEASGCMRMIPGSHKNGACAHVTYDDNSNILLQSQTVHGVDESRAVICPLQPGEASFHHGWALHASMPNRSGDRRIGLNVQYLAPHVRQTKHDRDSAILVRGQDRFGNFRENIPASADFEPDAVQRWHDMCKLQVETQGTM